MNLVNLETHLENSSYLGYCLNDFEMFINKTLTEVRFKNIKIYKKYSSFGFLGTYFWYKKKL